ncbi:MAG TPA: isoprenylcysteine carboxylmethyltransferase family protein [Candidatus Kryptobacter bacterium]|nr:isoprenylcysteine carboxylmethyltransferase family protein [Candidatus Kryptobacter bacterium]
MNPLYIFLLFLSIQRIIELVIAGRHERILMKLGAVEVDPTGYRVIVAMHAAFFVSLVLESLAMKRSPSQYWILLSVIFAAAQLLRYWAISSLGVYWNTKIILAPNHPPITRGPYKYIRHPNYAAVIAEIAIIPLIFSCYITAALFTFINALLLRRRIRIETIALGMAHKENG